MIFFVKKWQNAKGQNAENHFRCNSRVLFSKIVFWVEVNSKNLSKRGGLFKKKPKNWTFQIIWAYIQEWGSISVHTIDYAINFLHLCPLPDLMPIFLQC